MKLSIKRVIKKWLIGCIQISIILTRPIVKKCSRKKVVILIDRHDAAGDNAEAMYRCLKNREDCEAYFILSRTSKDWQRLQPDDHVIDLLGFRYIWIMMKADIAMYSHVMRWPRFCFNISGHFDIKQVFLQHGVIHEDLSRVYNATKGHDLVCVATEAEYKDRLRPAYGYSPEQICLTGLPRFDYLDKHANKVITIGLTWRFYLKRAPEAEVLTSAYYQMIESLIIRPELADLAEKYGYTIQMVPHPELSVDFIRLLGEKKDSRVLINTQQTYSEIISDTSLLITDYSSLAFDAAYLKTPVVYYQADQQEFFSGKHTYTKSYFDFDRDGFGEVVYRDSDLLSAVESYMKTACQIKEKYRDRAEKTFAYLDHNNCTRVWEAAREKLWTESKGK